MDNGRIIESGEVFDVFSSPKNVSSQKFVGTVVKGVPSPAELAVLRERHNGRIVTFSFRDGDSSQAQVFLDLAGAGLDFELIYGGINDIRGRAFGHLTLAIRGDASAIDRALASIAERVEVTVIAGEEVR
jgi:D-methionine transport system ATP-binding protein